MGPFPCFPAVFPFPFGPPKKLQDLLVAGDASVRRAIMRAMSSTLFFTTSMDGKAGEVPVDSPIRLLDGFPFFSCFFPPAALRKKKETTQMTAYSNSSP